ncbi:hypothetical protein U9M48_001729 [Paspalum notatum var. saurae]|uniref:Uncharacterized protein n=1 Tax=Paspalum notatum var. saurae TaxID=547442 RepID=A0AAQ3SD39_PASNO
MCQPKHRARAPIYLRSPHSVNGSAPLWSQLPIPARLAANPIPSPKSASPCCLPPHIPNPLLLRAAAGYYVLVRRSVPVASSSSSVSVDDVLEGTDAPTVHRRSLQAATLTGLVSSSGLPSSASDSIPILIGKPGFHLKDG